jgi:parvulin-like peptidyl-prolyl isomerase
MTESERQAAQQSARNIVARLAKGEDFSLLAREYSDDQYSGERGGDLGWLSLKTIDQIMASEAQQLDVGQTSDVIKTQYGFHVLKLLSPVKEVLAPFENVQGDIRYELRQKAKTEEVKRLLGSVSVKVNE